ncbi:argininosuccinate lyase [Alphaproteobacteria bacterium]|nr:argininosuccinate lyase [Alphaproteobacteria bacterium]
MNKKSKILSTTINKNTSTLMDDFNSSIDIDKRLIEEDIAVTSAHVKALTKLKIISKKEALTIQKGLISILNDHKKGKLKFSKKNEDIHMNVESFLYEKIGEVANKIHTGRSRNDQVATDTRLWTIKASKNLKNEIKKLMGSILDQAQTNEKTIIPGFTHLQVAQPISLAHHLIAYLEMFKRDLDYFDFCKEKTDENVLGSAALAGSNYNLDLNLLNKNLNFTKSKNNSMDGVSDRDFCMYFLHASSLTATHLSKLSSELVIWSSNFMKLFNISNQYSTGSSIMPQKRNPDSLELIRAKTNTIRIKSLEFSNIISNLPLTYFKDFQEDKRIIFDCYDELLSCLKVMQDVIKKSKFEQSVGRDINNNNYATATDLADYLVIEKKITFRDSYKIIADIVSYAQQHNKNLSEITIDEYKKFQKVIDKNIYKYVDVDKSLSRKKTSMSTNPKEVSRMIKKYLKFLNV